MYGGTKEEMSRLIDDANAYAAANGKAADLSIESFSDIVTAIELIQEKQGIAGTTAKEAATTIEGSIAMTKAAWTNLLTEFGKDDGNVGLRVTELVESAKTALLGSVDEKTGEVRGGIIPRAQQIFESIAAELPNMVPMLVEVGTQVFGALGEAIGIVAPAILDAVMQTFTQLAQTVRDNREQLAEGAVQAFESFIYALAEITPVVLEAVIGLLLTIAGKIVEHAPDILTAIGTLLNNLVDGMAAGFLSATDEARKGMGDVLVAIGSFFQGMLDNGAALIGGLAQGIASAAGGVAQGAADTVQGALDRIGEFFENMKTAGGNLVQGLIDGIVNAPGDVAQALWDTVGGGVDQLKAWLGIASPSKLMEELGGYTIEGFTNGVNALAGMAQGAMGGVARTVLGAMSSEIDGSKGDYVGLMGENMDAMVQRVGDAYSYIMNMGRYVVDGLLQGLNANMDAVTNILFGGVNGAIEYVKGFLGIASPSKLMAKLGGYTMEGLAKGIGDGAGDAERAMRDAVGSVYGAASGAIELAAGVAPASGAIGGAAGVTAPQINIIVNDPVIKEEADVDRILEYAKVKIAREMGVASWNPSASMA
jgi:phage-related protein